jgi:hypothetical protein
MTEGAQADNHVAMTDAVSERRQRARARAGM